MPQIPNLEDGAVVNELHWADLASAANNTQTGLFGSTTRTSRPMFASIRQPVTTALAGGTDVTLTWTIPGSQVNNASMWNDVAPGDIGIKLAGVYRVSACASFSCTGVPVLYATLNGGGVDKSSFAASSGANNGSGGASSIMSFSVVRRFNLNDYIRILLWPTPGGGTLRGATEWGSTSVSVEFLHV